MTRVWLIYVMGFKALNDAFLAGLSVDLPYLLQVQRKPGLVTFSAVGPLGVSDFSIYDAYMAVGRVHGILCPP